MASKAVAFSAIAIALAFALFVEGALGKIECANLSKDTCAYAVSSVGKRCVLEKHVRRSGAIEYACVSSAIKADQPIKDYIETDYCIKACGLDRSALGISSDSLLESHFARKLCSLDCYGSCPNVVDLYYNLAVGEGVYLPKLCEGKGVYRRREVAEIKSDGYVTLSPESPEYIDGVKFLYATSPAPY